MIKNRKLKIFLCDLTHDTQILVSDTIPINVGFVGAYALMKFPTEIELNLFKYPETLLCALHEETPDIIGFSNYSWNSRLSERFARYAKKLYPNIVTVMGGTNFPQVKGEQARYLKSRPEIDFHIFNEGEIAFSNIVGTWLSVRDSNNRLFDRIMDGVSYIDPDSRNGDEYEFRAGHPIKRIKDLDEIPSPYLTGLLDKFFDGRLTPFIETNRGCPFTCSFCHTGHHSLSKISKFSPERIKEEIAYIATRAQELNISNLHLADTNFGMYTSDKETCAALASSREEYGWPTQIQATTGKNSKKKIIDITRIMGSTLAVNMSVQSMDKEVLNNIDRSNISLEDYKEIHKTLMSEGRSSNGELIIGLPGETKETFVRGLKQVIDAGVTRVANYTLMLLYGTDFKDPKYRSTYAIKGQYRLVPLNFGEYMGEKVFDIEEVGIETNTMSFEDYLWLRGLCLFTEVVYNNRPFLPIFYFLETLSIDQFEFVLQLFQNRSKSPPRIYNLVTDFEHETKSELWSSEEALVEFYRREENYGKLLAGEVGGNLIYKYKAASLAYYSSDWIEFIRVEAVKAIENRNLLDSEKTQLIKELGIVCKYTELRLRGVLEVDANTDMLTHDFECDLLAWLNERNVGKRTLRDYAAPKPLTYEFRFSERQLSERNEYFGRYGTHVNALSKIVARVTNVEQLYRNVNLQGDMQVDADQIVDDEMVRYAISN